MRMKQMMLITLGCLLLSMTTIAAASDHHDHSLTVGKKGEITLTQPTKVGNTVLQPDTYVVQHRTSGDKHFVRFLELKKVTFDNRGKEGDSFTYTEQDNAGEINCRMEPTGSIAKATKVSISGDRITEVTIKGENAAHLF